MLVKISLESQIDNYLNEQRKLENRRNKIIDSFNERYSKKEVKSYVDFLLQNVASTYSSDLQDFINHYGSEDKNTFTVKDIKTFLSLIKVYKNQMKEPILEENTEEQDEAAEVDHE